MILLKEDFRKAFEQSRDQNHHIDEILFPMEGDMNNTDRNGLTVV